MEGRGSRAVQRAKQPTQGMGQSHLMLGGREPNCEVTASAVGLRMQKLDAHGEGSRVSENGDHLYRLFGMGLCIP